MIGSSTAATNVGIAKLRVERKENTSVVVDELSQAPLQLHRPLYLDDETFPTVYLKTPSSGLLGGDEHRIDVVVGDNSQLRLRTQAATLVYPGLSSLFVDITVENGGKLTFLPHPIILGARGFLKQRVRIRLASDASLEYLDTWCAGRIAMQESWQFECFDYSLEISRNEKLLYRENWTLYPQRTGANHQLLCGDYTHFSTLFSCGEFACVDRIAAALPHSEWETNQTWTMERAGDLISKRCARVKLG